MNEFKTIFIIPCKNEVTRIGNVITSLKFTIPDARVLVLDDNSEDLSAHEANYSGAEVLHFNSSKGYGPVIIEGFQYALRKGYNCVVLLDGDGQHRPEDVQKVWNQYRASFPDADIVSGSRYLSSRKMIGLRYLGSRLLSLLFFITTGRLISDPTSGLQCLNESALNLFCRTGATSRYRDLDIWYLCHLAGLRIIETPIEHIKRPGGTSMHQGTFHILKYIMNIPLSLYKIHQEWAAHQKSTTN